MTLLDDVTNALTSASQGAVTAGNQAQTQAQSAAGASATVANACGEGFTGLASARSLAAQAHEQAGRSEALLSAIELGSFLPVPTTAQVTAAIQKVSDATAAAQDADDAIANAEPTVRTNYLKCATQFAVDHIKSCADDAKTNGASASGDADQKAADAQTVSVTPPKCAEGLDKWRDAEGSVRTLEGLSAKGQGCLDLMTAGVATGLFPISPADQQTVIQDVTAANGDRADSEGKVDAAFAPVLANHDACKTLAPLTSCVTNGANTAKQATEQVPNPIAGQPAGHLDAVVQSMTASAAATNATRAGGCNEGVQLLADAVALIDKQVAAADLGTLQTCVGQLAAVVAPNDSTLTQGQQALSNANNIIAAARALLDPANPTTHQVWEKRVVCTVTSGTVSVHVTDESGDDFGSGATVSVSNFPLNKMLPVEFPDIALPNTDGSGHASASVPLAPEPMGLPASTPPAPTDLPTTDAATLTFSVSHPNRESAQGSLPVDHAGTNLQIEVPVADTSL